MPKNSNMKKLLKWLNSDQTVDIGYPGPGDGLTGWAIVMFVLMLIVFFGGLIAMCEHAKNLPPATELLNSKP